MSHNFSHFCLFSHSKCCKGPTGWPAYSPEVTLQNDSCYSMLQWEGHMFFASEVFPAMSDGGAGIQKFVQIFH